MQSASGRWTDRCRSADRSVPARLGRTDGVYLPDGRDRRYHPDVRCRTGDGSEGADQDGACRLSDRLRGRLYSSGSRHLIIYGVLRRGSLGQRGIL